MYVVRESGPLDDTIDFCCTRRDRAWSRVPRLDQCMHIGWSEGKPHWPKPCSDGNDDSASIVPECARNMFSGYAFCPDGYGRYHYYGNGCFFGDGGECVIVDETTRENPIVSRSRASNHGKCCTTT